MAQDKIDESARAWVPLKAFRAHHLNPRAGAHRDHRLFIEPVHEQDGAWPLTLLRVVNAEDRREMDLELTRNQLADLRDAVMRTALDVEVRRARGTLGLEAPREYVSAYRSFDHQMLDMRADLQITSSHEQIQIQVYDDRTGGRVRTLGFTTYQSTLLREAIGLRLHQLDEQRRAYVAAQNAAHTPD